MLFVILAKISRSSNTDDMKWGRDGSGGGDALTHALLSIAISTAP